MRMHELDHQAVFWPSQSGHVSSRSRQLDLPRHLLVKSRVEPAAVVLHLDIVDHIPLCRLATILGSAASYPENILADHTETSVSAHVIKSGFY
ncbi:hypothetical protein VRRI112168_19245 [Vreelandella rituensis]